MTVEDEVLLEQKEQELLRAIGQRDAKARELTAAKTFIKNQQAEISRLEVVRDFLKVPLEQAPPWKPPKTNKAKKEVGIVCLLLSDLHLDEVVRPEELLGKNAYNRDIAELRLKRVFDALIEQTTFYHQGTTYQGCHVLLGGDLVSGFIHEELRETNEVPIPATIAHWTPKIAEGLKLLADTFGAVHVTSVVGNHGRMTPKPRYKLRALDNADWLISVLLAGQFANDKRFTFNIPEGTDAFVELYDVTLLLTHGDQAKGGTGQAGILPPIQRLKLKKQGNNVFDTIVVGHWHQYVSTPGLIVNGALKGYDEFASGLNFAFEEPRQAAWIATPERGITWPIEIFCQDRKAEGW